MPDNGPPTVITPEAREVIQGVYAGTQNEGLRIAGLAEVQSIEDTLVGSTENPTNLGPTVEISVPLDADGNPIPQIEDRTEFQPASAVLTIRVTPQQEFGGEFFSAHAQVVDVATGHIIDTGRSGATSDERTELEGGRPESVYGNDPKFYAGLLNLESKTVEEAVGIAVGGLTGETGITLPPPAATPAAPSGTPAVSDASSGSIFDSIPGGVLTPIATGGAVVVVTGMLLFGGGDGNDGSNLGTGSDQNSSSSSPGGSSGGGTSGGSSAGPQTFAVTDETGDFVPTWEDSDPIENPNIAGDVTELSVEVDEANSRTVITVRFAGAAQQFSESGAGELSGDILLSPPDGGRIHNILLRPDGTSKLSDPPSGMSLTMVWTAPDTLVFTVEGYTPPDGSTVSLRTLQNEQRAFSSDEVAVQIGS